MPREQEEMQRGCSEEGSMLWRCAPHLGTRQQVIAEAEGVKETVCKPRAGKGNSGTPKPKDKYKKEPMKEAVGEKYQQKEEIKGVKRFWKVGVSLKENHYCTYKFMYKGVHSKKQPKLNTRTK